MGDMAVDSQGNPVFASAYPVAEWELLKQGNTGFVLPCCSSPAVLKTSPNGLPFFAHLHDECATSPETLWHLNAKQSLVQGVLSLGIDARLEVSGGKHSRKWTADIYFEHADRRYAIEVQRSYQHLRDYQARQSRYRQSGVESFWVLMKDRYLTTSKSITKHRLRTEFNNVWPADLEVARGINQISNLPLVWFDPTDSLSIKSPGFFTASIPVWIQAIIDGRFCYRVDGWKIR